MLYRDLGNTGLRVSAIGLGCAQLGSSSTDYAVNLVQRALELDVNYFDVARGYRDAEIKIGLALKGQRERAIISTKTGARTRDDAWRDIHESLERLQTDHVENCHVHGLRSGEDMDKRLGPGGALEALVQAKEEGLIQHIGCTSHRSETLVEALQRFDFEVILVPMNVVEREPLDELIPLCQEKGVGVTIMKPVATGLLPAPLALKWLLNQPIATAVPGATEIHELEENALVGHRDLRLSAEEEAEVKRLKEYWEHRRCRICGLCEPCPKGINIGGILGTDVMYDHYRTMGRERFRNFDWSRAAIERDLEQRKQSIAAIESCDYCGQCEERCPYGLPIMKMLHDMLPAMEDMVGIYQELLST
ncbi:MAG: aldo/keto reductase [Chloroflexota bacterium]|nr:aldo/keto reductase [Chloroflexota bacterium]